MEALRLAEVLKVKDEMLSYDGRFVYSSFVLFSLIMCGSKRIHYGMKVEGLETASGYTIHPSSRILWFPSAPGNFAQIEFQPPVVAMMVAVRAIMNLQIGWYRGFIVRAFPRSE